MSETPSAWTSPDLTVSFTEEQSLMAFDMFDHFDWATIESNLEPGALDVAGQPIDRRNKNLRLMVMAECFSTARDAEPGEGLDMMSNPTYRTAMDCALRVFDKSIRRNR